ncbi:PRC-barrel domain-containing protein [Microvirga sp. 17 mud 1-3]|uniref:PRC-barrel domain-containing protein n=1 Tax=Microvirga sp. 17 mud 1-3 TaxID=2082949 RepID=UPI000D6C4C78|nr:PRC-barrel domain-containing protein [Microvirga sp. 17 mud 1-3]AWM87871.1 photosystem reaction center subunit H [Microvirga sp. 17 mud 1-3]
MRSFMIAFTAATFLSGAAYAQTAPAAPAASAPAAHAVQVPQDAIMSGQLDDLDLRNSANEKVGEIEDIVISQGRVVGYVISVGGFLGVGDRNIVVDPGMVNVSYNENDKKWHATINATKDQLKAVPEFKYEGRWKE